MVGVERSRLEKLIEKDEAVERKKEFRTFNTVLLSVSLGALVLLILIGSVNYLADVCSYGGFLSPDAGGYFVIEKLDGEVKEVYEFDSLEEMEAFYLKRLGELDGEGEVIKASRVSVSCEG